LIIGLLITRHWVTTNCPCDTQSFVDIHVLFPQLYEINGIDAQIAKYGPQNRNRVGFETTTKAERGIIFGEIVEAVNNSGIGLEKIVYRAPSGEVIDSFLTQPEIDHLNDVARLIGYLNKTLLYLTAFLFCLVTFFKSPEKHKYMETFHCRKVTHKHVGSIVTLFCHRNSSWPAKSVLCSSRVDFCRYGSLVLYHVNRASIWEHINFIGGNRICFLAFAISSDQKNFGLDVA